MSSQHPLNNISIPIHQQYQQQSYHRQQTPLHSQPQDHQLRHQRPLQYETSLITTTTTDIKLPLELGLHGTVAFLSLYAVYSILATIRFQNLHGYTSLTALFLLLATATSFVMAVGYMILAWWARTAEGAAHIRSHLLLQRHDRLTSDVETLISTTKPNNRGVATLSRSAKLVTRAIVRVSVFLVSPLPRLCILIGLVVACSLAATMQWYKIRNGIDCAAVAPEYRRFCATTKAAVTSTTVTTCFWIVWLGLWFRRSYSVFRGEQRTGEHHGGQESSGGHGEEVLVAMSDEAHGASRVTDLSQPFKHTVHINNPQMDSHLQYPQNNHTPHSMSPQQQQKEPFSSGKTIDGLGIDITTTTNGDNGAETSSSHITSASSKTVFDSSIPQLPVGSRLMMDAETASIVGKSATSIARDNIFERKKPNPSRLHDHAKVFPMARASGSNLQEAADGSTRGTPVIYTAGSPAQLTIGGGGSPSISGVTTPTTPRARAGYMGKETLKALNSLPKLSSMGTIVAHNIMNPTAPSFSVHASPIPNNSHFGENYNNFPGTPNSLKSYRSMNVLPQSPADVALAEQSMDEQLKAIRRRSFVTDVMNSPGGPASMLESAQMNSPSLMMSPRVGGGSEVGSIMGMGSPSSVFSRGKGKFRAAFSSPSLNTLAGGSGRRRSSLAMTLMINSTVNSPAGSDNSSSSSSYYSPAGSATTSRSADYSSLRRRGSDTETTSSDNDGQSSLYYSNSRNRQQNIIISAQELLRAEYGDLYPDLSDAGLDDMENMNLETDSIASMGRPRSNSVSSAGTSRSSGGSSYSPSNEQGQGQGQGRVKQPGPPPSLMNKVRSGAGNYRLPRNQQRQQQQPRNVGPNENLTNKWSSSLNSKKFPSYGDLTKYSWDYRKQLPID
ncbi:hypothetical protein BG015_009473 [Linnemannia schmuckeri]|uniref:Uncharacterized protein n=1 Tax=Linnemannia schmuckeri TaxID=64567 RepID=A0A9P5RYZ2_9FUNG|nr:hypothetical protein BG015_009473 [Linnemannia schmuckeri]